MRHPTRSPIDASGSHSTGSLQHTYDSTGSLIPQSPGGLGHEDDEDGDGEGEGDSDGNDDDDDDEDEDEGEDEEDELEADLRISELALGIGSGRQLSASAAKLAHNAAVQQQQKRRQSNYNCTRPFPFPSQSQSQSQSQSLSQPRGEDPRLCAIAGQTKCKALPGLPVATHSFFNLRVIFEPHRTGFEDSKTFKETPGTLIASRYEVLEVLGTAAFSSALHCLDLSVTDENRQSVCLKCVKNSKDFFDQSIDEIKLLQYINSQCVADDKHVLRLIDFFYYKEHLFIVTELLRENLYEFGRSLREEQQPTYFTLPRLKLIAKQCLEALEFIHGLLLIHCDVKPENIVVQSYSRCLVKIIDFGSSCYTTDKLTTYIQSRSYR